MLRIIVLRLPVWERLTWAVDTICSAQQAPLSEDQGRGWCTQGWEGGGMVTVLNLRKLSSGGLPLPQPPHVQGCLGNYHLE